MNGARPSNSRPGAVARIRQRFTGLERPLVIFVCLVALWQGIIFLAQVPHFILPSPLAVAQVLVSQAPLLFEHAVITTIEIVAGLVVGSLAGFGCALILSCFNRARGWLLPVLVMSQAIPVFALAPLLTLWFGYDMTPKIIMAGLIIFFPVTAAGFDGLRNAPVDRIELARSMGADRWAILRHIRLPSALPSVASGLRVAVAVAPIGAIVGEWVGSSKGLGYLMLHANGRMQTDLMFAALLVLFCIALLLYFSVNRWLDHWLSWQPDTTKVFAAQNPAS